MDNMWSKVKKTTQDSLSVLLSKHSDAFLTLASDTSDEIAFVWVLSLIPKCVYAKTNMIHGSGSGILDIILKMTGLENSPSRVNLLAYIVYK